jgi:hypothetical protein
MWVDKDVPPLKIKISFYKIYVTRYDYNLTIMKLQISQTGDGQQV